MNRTETRQRLIESGIAAERLPLDGQFDLREANLSGADLCWANLNWADLRRADLSRAVLSEADLSEANLSGANLREANLSGADLSWANLSGADLRRADLSRADLSGADGPFTTGSFGQHTATAAGGYISIGCERHDYDWWLANYEACGQCNGYTPEESADYGAWIALAVARQRRIEQQPETAA
jgi:hypothetical protein